MSEVVNTEEVKNTKRRVSSPRFVETHKDLCKELHTTFCRKNKDYGSSFHQSINEFGLSAAGVRISDKYNRIITLLKNNDPAVKDESLVDSLKDLANYCLMTVMEVEGRKKHE